MGLVLDILDNEVRKKIAAADEVLKEARARRDLVAESAMDIEGSLRWFRSGSVAHAMVNKPVSDADSGLVLDRRSYPTLGPRRRQRGPGRGDRQALRDRSAQGASEVPEGDRREVPARPAGRVQ
jgi:hypothetical protein